MDIENIWKQNSGGDEQLDRLLQQVQLEKLKSKLPLHKLKNTLVGGITWGMLITIGYAIIFFTTVQWQVRLSLLVVSLFNVWIMLGNWWLYKRINANVDYSNNLKQELQKNYESLRRWWRMQEKASLFVYPVAVTGGFIFGGILASGKTVEDFLYRPKVLIGLSVSLVVLVPACYWLARWMFNYSYGRHLQKLKATIEELE